MTSKKSICIAVQLFYPENQAMAVRTKYLAEAFIDAGYNTTVLTSARSKGIKEFNVITAFTPVSTNRDNTYVRLFKELVFAFEVFIRILFSSSTLFMISSPPFTIGFAAVMASRMRGKKYIFDVRDEYPEVYFTEGLINENGTFGKWLKSIEKHIYQKSLVTTTVTDRIVDKLIKKSGTKDKIYLLRNGFADNILPIKTLSLDPFVILFHGNMGKFQNPSLIVEVAKRCADLKLPVEFWVYGWGNQTQIILDAESNLENLTHKGELSHAQIPEILEKTSLGISFQGNTEISKNSFPSKVMEFIGSGIPMLVTPISEAGDFVEKHEVGFQFSPDDPKAIVECIQRLQANHDEVLNLSANAQKIRKSLSRKTVSEEFVKHLTAAAD